MSSQAKAAKRSPRRSAANGLVASIGGALLRLGAGGLRGQGEAFQALAADAEGGCGEQGRRCQPRTLRWTPSGQTVGRQLRELAVKIGEKLEVSAAAYFDGRTAVYLHRRASNLPPRVGVLIEYEGSDESVLAAPRDADCSNASALHQP